jgi:hypothetical protein
VVRTIIEEFGGDDNRSSRQGPAAQLEWVSLLNESAPAKGTPVSGEGEHLPNTMQHYSSAADWPIIARRISRRLIVFA